MNSKGFTIIELMIATIIFASILLGATTVLLQISRLYYGGVTQTQTQQITRSIVADVSSQVQFSAGTITTPPKVSSLALAPDKLTVKAICIGSTRYTYAWDAQVDPGATDGQWYGGTTATDHHLQHALWRDTVASGSASCNPLNLSLANPEVGVNAGTNGQELLAPNMRLSDFTVARTGTNLWTVSVHVIYGDDDLMAPDFGTQAVPPTGCKSIIGSQWCASSALSTQVYQRIH